MALSRTVKKRTKFIILQLLGGIFGGVWIGAAIAAVYFLYGCLANDAPWSYVLWSAATGLVVKQIAAAFTGIKQRLDYEHQLIERGYPPAEASGAWRISTNGGLNLLLNLQQAEKSRRRN